MLPPYSTQTSMTDWSSDHSDVMDTVDDRHLPTYNEYQNLPRMIDRGDVVKAIGWIPSSDVSRLYTDIWGFWHEVHRSSDISRNIHSGTMRRPLVFYGI